MAKEVTIWRPFRELTPFMDFDRMRREMDRLWDSFFDLGVRRKGEEGADWVPSLDVSETKSDIIVKLEIPGMDPKDLDLSLSDGTLTIKGEKKREHEEKDENYHCIERSYGSFVRSIPLPKEVKHDKVSASYKNGVLKVVLPKSEEARTKEVKIKVE